jgi:hypothetical protein
VFSATWWWCSRDSVTDSAACRTTRAGCTCRRIRSGTIALVVAKAKVFPANSVEGQLVEHNIEDLYFPCAPPPDTEQIRSETRSVLVARTDKRNEAHRRRRQRPRSLQFVSAPPDATD